MLNAISRWIGNVPRMKDSVQKADIRKEVQNKQERSREIVNDIDKEHYKIVGESVERKK